MQKYADLAIKIRYTLSNTDFKPNYTLNGV